MLRLAQHDKRRALLFCTLTSLLTPAVARAQGQATPLGIRSGRDTIVAAATITAPFMVRNSRPDTVVVLPHVELPASWTALTGSGEIAVAPGESGMLMLSVAVPSRAAAGVYPVRVVVTTARDPEGVMDSVIVRVPPRRGVEVALQDRPGFVVSGKSYQTTFVVRNRGNAPGAIRVSARSSLSRLTLSDSAFSLPAEGSRVVRVVARAREGLQSAIDDVLELEASQLDADSAHAVASVRTTVVPEPTRAIEEYQRLPARVQLRAASSNGVSPFEISGQGKLVDGGTLGLSFLARAPTGPFSAFGERDEYRAELRAPSWRLRAGDQLFMLSTLTGSGQPGFGLGADGDAGMFSFGAYGQEFRRTLERGSESGLFLTARPREDASVTMNLVDRAGGLLPGRVVSGSAALDRTYYRADVEVARSQGESGPGFARSARLSAGVPTLSVDLGHRSADTSFAGSQRAADHYYLTGHAQPWKGLAFNASASRQEADLSRTTGVPYVERFDIGSLSATIYEQLTLDAGMVNRSANISGIHRESAQQTLRARTDYWFPIGTVLLELEGGQAQHADGSTRTFADASIGFRRTLGSGSIGVRADRYTGGGVTRGMDAATTLGGDVSVGIGRGTHLSLMAYGTRVETGTAPWHSQVDALVSHTMRNGSSVSLRARILGGGSYLASERNVAYLEYGIPLSVPVSRLRTTGRVYGRVVDATSGQGVPNALVRLGPQVAITDREGKVAFGGVPGGEHRLSMSQETSFADAVFVGDPTLMVDSLRPSPTTFTLAIARSASIDVDVRRFVLARTGVGGAPDSLSEAGALANATLMLVGARDTLYRTTGVSGRVTFRDVPPGDWVLRIRGDAPAQQRFEPDRVELTLTPGESRSVAFRLIPRRREVQLIGDETELRPTAAGARTQAPATGTKTIKPKGN